MMGRHAKQSELWSTTQELSRRIPADNILRKINRLLDLDFVRQEVSSLYGQNGNESVDPVQIMKMMLLLFLDNVSSERELMRIIPLRIDYMWFLGYGLEDKIPHHSVLSKARARWGFEVFSGLFKKTVELCWKKGLIDGSKIHVDSSVIRADASLNSIVKVTVEKLEEDESEGEGMGVVNQQHRSTTDPESTLSRRGGGSSAPSYQVHRAHDDKKGVITAVQTTTGAVNEAHELPELVRQHQEHTGCQAQAVVGDSKYGTAANFIFLAKSKIRAHMGDNRSKMVIKSAEGIYRVDQFEYVKAGDYFLCPAGQRLEQHHFVATRGYYEYRTKVGICQGCPLRESCTRAKDGRSVKRYEGQEYLDRARRQSRSQQAKQDRVKRQWLVEGKFGLAAVHHGMKRSRWRGMWKQAIQDYMIAGIQNLLVLLWPFFRAKSQYLPLVSHC